MVVLDVCKSHMFNPARTFLAFNFSQLENNVDVYRLILDIYYVRC